MGWFRSVRHRSSLSHCRLGSIRPIAQSTREHGFVSSGRFEGSKTNGLRSGIRFPASLASFGRSFLELGFVRSRPLRRLRSRLLRSVGFLLGAWVRSVSGILDFGAGRFAVALGPTIETSPGRRTSSVRDDRFFKERLYYRAVGLDDPKVGSESRSTGGLRRHGSIRNIVMILVGDFHDAFSSRISGGADPVREVLGPAGRRPGDRRF